MKNLLKYTGIALITAAILTACTDNFERMNTNPKQFTNEDLKQDNNLVGMNFPPLMKSIYFSKSANDHWIYQLVQNLNADIWSGYMAAANESFAASNNNMHYALNSGWNSYCWDYAYNDVMSQSLRISEFCAEDKETYAHFDAINTIIRVLCMSRVCDQYGALIYSKYGDSNTGGIYDSGQDAYKEFFAELTEASKILTTAMSQKVAAFERFDMVYAGDLAQWAKMCNSLRLRLAIRIVKYDAETARKEAEAAIADANGLIKVNDDNFTISGMGYRNPLYGQTAVGQYHDTFLGANVTSILGGYEDPRLPKYGMPNINGEIVGIRTGLSKLDGEQSKIYKKGTELSLASSLNIPSFDTPVIMFAAAETYFLLSEAALRGWNIGSSAKEFYEQGIRTSFDQWGAAMGEYLNSTNKPQDFVDALDPEYNHAAMFTATPKWDDAATDEERLEKIITQKWIAVFPEGMNAWAEYRRTGYPKQFPIMRNDSQGVIDTNLGVRRLPFTVSEKDNNKAGYPDAVQKLGGPDTGTTRVFWDIDKPNI